jgi:hypothetical protein
LPSDACFITLEGVRCEPTTGWYSETTYRGQGGFQTSVYRNGRLCYSLSGGGAAPFAGALVTDSSGTFVGFMEPSGTQWVCSYPDGSIPAMPAECATWVSLVTPTTDHCALVSRLKSNDRFA